MAELDINKHIEDALAQGKGWSEEERKAYIDNIPDDHPLFAESADSQNGLMEALKDLAFENKDDIGMAERFKEEGNKFFQRGRKNKMYFRKASTSYSDALKHIEKALVEHQERELAPGTAEHQPQGGTTGEGGVTEAEEGIDQRLEWETEKRKRMVELKATLYANRAACHLSLKNYGTVKHDCEMSLKLVPGNVKCIYRKAKAQHALKQLKEAVTTCDEALAIESENKLIIELKEAAIADLKQREEKAKQLVNAKQAVYNQVGDLFERCLQKGVRLGASGFQERNYMQHSLTFPQPQQQQGLKGGGDLDGIGGGDGGPAYQWPVLLLYPQYSQSDFLQSVGEGEMVAQHLARVFPEEGPFAPWDLEREYKSTQLVAYLRVGGIGAFDDREDCIAQYKLMEALRDGKTPPVNGHNGGAADEDEVDFWGKEEVKWLIVHPACTLIELLRFDDYVVGGFAPVLHIFPQNCEAHRIFRKEYEVKFISYVPEALIQKTKQKKGVKK